MLLLKGDGSCRLVLLSLLLGLASTDPPTTEHRCSPNQFACLSGKTQCIPLDWQCDGWTACDDQSDELDCHPIKEERFRFGSGFDQVEEVVFNKKCPSGWHHYEKTASCYKAFLKKENFWQAVDTCQKVNGSLATFVTDEELQFILKIDVEFDDKVCEQTRDQCKFWVGYQYVITTQNHSLVGHWEVAYKGLMQAFLPPDSLPGFSQEAGSSSSSSKQDNVYCGQLQRFQSRSMNERGLHSWNAENCYKKFPFLCKRRQTCVDIRDSVVNEGYYFTPKGDDPCLSCTCHDGEPEMCIAALCERPQNCQHFRKDPKECCKFTCLDPDSSSLFDSMASGMRLIVSCISSFLILSLLLFMVHRLRQRRRQRIETLIGGNLHPFHLGRRGPDFDCSEEAFGTGLTPLHLSDDGDGGAFHFQEPPPPYYKYPDLPHPDDPPPPYEAAVHPNNLLYVELARRGVPVVPRQAGGTMSRQAGGTMSRQAGGTMSRCLQVAIPQVPQALPPVTGPAPQHREDSVDSSTLLVVPDTPTHDGHAPDEEDATAGRSLSTVV